MEIGITLNNELVFNKEIFIKKEKRNINCLAGEILKNKRLTRCTVFLITGLNITKDVLADTSDAFVKLDKAGWIFLGIVQKLGFWVCLIGCLLEILFAVFKEGKGKSALLPITLKWIGLFLAFYLLPEIFILIRDLFS
ncbi:hypothetical protein A500_04621 [Clostridium sartagoforme AAU1]|uniref:Uncharacterized protein n=1 Tax=Clostridium sartagoforme AAU1 TaxID=1202534 RepID=R9CDN4_9CLOT|nr:hypothetical protein [Clostridium sartagoforme]EOR27397.1 hypothetical protein A500_04621 [Clostridium sartagoforme AAU1]